jgi:hypothetical protein
MHTPRRPADLGKKGCCALLIGCLLLQGCGRSNPEPPPDILKAQREAMDRARATEQMVKDAAERREGQVDSQAK